MESFLQGRDECIDLEPGSIKETAVNEPLINWHAFDGEQALAALWATDGWARNVTDKRMLDLSRILKEKEGLQILPASTAGLAALTEPPRPDLASNDRFVAILTGRKF